MADAIFGFGFRIFAKNQASGPAKQATDSINNASRAVKNHSEEARGSAVASHQMSQGFTGAGAAASHMGAKIMALVTALAAYFSFRAMKGAFDNLIATGDQAERQLIVLQTLLGTHEKAVQAYQRAVEIAQDTPFQIEDVVQAMVKMKAFNIDFEKNLPLLANMAAGMGKSLEEAVYAVSLGAQGMSRSLRQSFAINTTEMKKFTDGMTPGTQAYSEAVLKYLNSIERFKHGMEIMRGSLGHVKSNLQDFVYRMKMAIVGLPGEGKLLDAWTKMLNNILGKLEKWEPKITKIFNAVGQVLSQAVRIVEQAWDSLWARVSVWIDRTSGLLGDQKNIVVPFLMWMELTYLKAKRVISAFVDGFREGYKGVSILGDNLKAFFDPLWEKGGSMDKANGGWVTFAENLGRVAAGFGLIIDVASIMFSAVEKAMKGWTEIFGVIGSIIDKMVAFRQIFFGNEYERKEILGNIATTARRTANDLWYGEKEKWDALFGQPAGVTMGGSVASVSSAAGGTVDNSLNVVNPQITIQAPNMETYNVLKNGTVEMSATMWEEIQKKVEMERVRKGVVK